MSVAKRNLGLHGAFVAIDTKLRSIGLNAKCHKEDDQTVFFKSVTRRWMPQKIQRVGLAYSFAWQMDTEFFSNTSKARIFKKEEIMRRIDNAPVGHP